MASFREVFSILTTFVISCCGIYLGLFLGVLILFPQKIEFKSLVLKPTQDDPSGGFKKIGQLIIGTSFSIIFLNIIGITLSGIGNIVQKILIEPLTPMEENILDFKRFGENYIWIFIIVAFSILIGIYAYITLMYYNDLLKKYKRNRLNPFLEKKFEVISKIVNYESKLKITNKDWNELQKYDYFIKEINSISNWPVRFTFIVTIFGTGFLPAILTLIFKLIEIFVLK